MTSEQMQNGDVKNPSTTSAPPRAASTGQQNFNANNQVHDFFKIQNSELNNFLNVFL